MNIQALHKISYGMYIVTSGQDSKCNGQIANTVFQVTAQPETVAVCINKQNYTHELIQRAGIFGISVLSKNASMKLIGGFGFRCGRDFDKFDGIDFKTGKTGIRIVLNDTVAYIEAGVIDQVEVGTHTIFVGKVVDAEILKNEEPMTYAYYHEIKRGLTPSTAPTYIETEKAKGEDEKMAEFRCTICGYIYDPAKGSPESGVRPGTPFEALPDTWTCPICGATKDQFERIG